MTGTMRLLTRYMVGLWLVGAVAASPAAGKTVALYEEGRPVPNGAKLDAEVSGPCYQFEPEVWSFQARMTANGAAPVVVSIEPPGESSCRFADFHPAAWRAELKEVHLSATHKTETVVATLFWQPGDPEHPSCAYEFQNPKGHFPLPGEAVVTSKLIGREIGEHTCARRKIRLQRQMTVTLRGSNGKVLEARYA